MHYTLQLIYIPRMSCYLSVSVQDNTYYNKAMSVQFSNNRTVCPPEPPTSKAKFLDLPDTVRACPLLRYG